MLKLAVAFFFGAYLLLSTSSVTYAQTPGSFSTTWKTDNPGTSSSTAITIPTSGTGYNYNIYWENVASSTINGSSTGNTGNTTINFPVVGTYRVDITGSFPRINFNFGNDRRKIISLDQWGNGAWTTMEGAFAGASNLVYRATDTPNLTNVTSLRSMFHDCFSLDGNNTINNWDVSKVTNFSSMFINNFAFNQPLNSWNTASATNMNAVFGVFGTTTIPLFDQPLSNWDVSRVTDMSFMFFNAQSFNKSLSSWNVQRVSNFAGMFGGATAFNHPLNSWNTASATAMNIMFDGATSFNQPLGDWNVGWVTNFNGMFTNAVAFNQPLATWNIASATTMVDMVSGSGWTPQSYTDTLQGWATLPQIPSNIRFSTSTGYYAEASSSRATLVGTYNWTIADGGLVERPIVATRTPASSSGGSSTRVGIRGTKNENEIKVSSPQSTAQEVQLLKTRIAQLQEEIATLKPQAEHTNQSCNFTRNLAFGSTGVDVRCLQQHLLRLGYYTWPFGTTAYYGAHTQSAVRAWQQVVEIRPALGYFGPVSRKAILGAQ